jgi:hypothetical protein
MIEADDKKKGVDVDCGVHAVTQLPRTTTLKTITNATLKRVRQSSWSTLQHEFTHNQQGSTRPRFSHAFTLQALPDCRAVKVGVAASVADGIAVRGERENDTSQWCA